MAIRKGLSERVDFFISYTAADKQWAEWIAWWLEEEGFRTIIQAWDFRPGSNFVAEMEYATASATRTIAVLSPNYLKSEFARSEWDAAFESDPRGAERKLVPVKVAEVDLEAFHRTRVYIDFVGLNPERARQALIDGVREGRAKPTNAPPFPGAAQEISEDVSGEATGRPPPAEPQDTLVPKLRRSFSDQDRRSFVREAFCAIHDHFSLGISRVSNSYPEVTGEFDKVHSFKFIAELFVKGQRRCGCKVWIGSFSNRSSAISFSEGSFTIDQDNSLNEQLTVESDGFSLHLKPLMGMQQFGHDEAIMSPKMAAAYLWKRFSSALER